MTATIPLEEVYVTCIEQAQQVEASAGYETPGTDAHAKKIRKAQALRKAAKCVELVAGKRGGQG